MGSSAAAQRLRAALDMYEFGERMYRNTLRRRDPAATSAQIDQRVRAWQQERPGAHLGDAEGSASDRFS